MPSHDDVYADRILSRIVCPINAVSMPPVWKIKQVMQAIYDHSPGLKWVQQWKAARDEAKPLILSGENEIEQGRSWKEYSDFILDDIGQTARDYVAETSGELSREQNDRFAFGQIMEQCWMAGALHAGGVYDIECKHPAFDLARLGILVVEIENEILVFGKYGKFLGKFRENLKSNNHLVITEDISWR